MANIYNDYASWKEDQEVQILDQILEEDGSVAPWRTVQQGAIGAFGPFGRWAVRQRHFQYWNRHDPVVLAIIDLIVAQNKIAYCEMDDDTYSYNYNHGQYMNNQMNWGKAIDERCAAAKQLAKAIRKQKAEAEERRRRWKKHYDAADAKEEEVA